MTPISNVQRYIEIYTSQILKTGDIALQGFVLSTHKAKK